MSFSKGVSNCYVFKSCLQVYVQKNGLPIPVYETIKEGPPHEPLFRSSVIVDDVRYESLPGFFTRKASEQSAAEVALLELSKSGDKCISQTVHETGLCKNMLQEYAQKMNHAVPLYHCQINETDHGVTRFSSTVEIGGTRYIGAAAKTIKEAKIEAARTALIAIMSDEAADNNSSHLTVVPGKKRAKADQPEDTANVPKAKKSKPSDSGHQVDHDQVGYGVAAS